MYRGSNKYFQNLSAGILCKVATWKAEKDQEDNIKIDLRETCHEDGSIFICPRTYHMVLVTLNHRFL
jgi:hypothetical protein